MHYIVMDSDRADAAPAGILMFDARIWNALNSGPHRYFDLMVPGHAAATMPPDNGWPETTVCRHITFALHHAANQVWQSLSMQARDYHTCPVLQVVNGRKWLDEMPGWRPVK